MRTVEHAWDVIRSRPGTVALLVGGALGAALPALVSGAAVAVALDRFLAGAVGGGLAALAVLGVTAAFAAAAGRVLTQAMAALLEPLRAALLGAVVAATVQRAVATDNAATAATAEGAAVERVTGQVENGIDMLRVMVGTAVPLVLGCVGAGVGITLLAPAAAAICLVPAVLAAVATAVQLPRLVRLSRGVLLAGEATGAGAATTVAVLRDAFGCGATAQVVEDFAHLVDAETGATVGYARAAALRGFTVAVAGQLPLIALLALAPWLLSTGQLTGPQLAGAATYLAVSLEPTLRGLSSVITTSGVELAVGLRRLDELMSAEPVTPPTWQRGDTGGDALVIRGLTFRYGASAAPVVDRLDLVVDYGEHLAVVGPSGIGKSTLAGLLTRTLTPQHGVVEHGPTGDVAPALIPQQAYVFGATVRENLAYLAPDAGDAELLAAAAAVGLDPVLHRLGGLDARIGPGSTALSDGERQLVALARTYASPARLVILDEATSALHPAAEAVAEDAFASRPGTLVVIAHRASSARRADRVLLLDPHEVRVGTHDTLMACSARYATLFGERTQSTA